MSEEKKNLHEIMKFRIEKLESLKESGVDPYPHKFAPTHQQRNS